MMDTKSVTYLVAHILLFYRYSRRFFMNKRYDSCSIDTGWFVVVILMIIYILLHRKFKASNS